MGWYGSKIIALYLAFGNFLYGQARTRLPTQVVRNRPGKCITVHNASKGLLFAMVAQGNGGHSERTPGRPLRPFSIARNSVC
jgi:hypothetical protein